MVKNVPNPLGNGNAGASIAKILRASIDIDIQITPFDGRAFYLTYILRSGVYHRKKDDIVALYDEDGSATIDLSRAKWCILRSPLPYVNLHNCNV